MLSQTDNWLSIKWGWQKSGRIQEVRLIWHYLTFDTEINSSRTPEQLHQLRQATLELIRRIETDKQFLPKEGPLCNWCNYQGSAQKENISLPWEAFHPMNI